MESGKRQGTGAGLDPVTPFRPPDAKPHPEDRDDDHSPFAEQWDLEISDSEYLDYINEKLSSSNSLLKKLLYAVWIGNGLLILIVVGLL